jgi:hypothetical protein
MAKLLNTLGPDSGAEFFKEDIDVILFNELVSPDPGEAAGITESPSMKLLRELRPKLLSHCLSLTPRRSYKLPSSGRETFFGKELEIFWLVFW